jgi:hypothetical protein
MSVELESPERLAMLVHRYREALAPDFGLPSSASPDWAELSQHERNRMVAATRLALLDLRSAPSQMSPGYMPAFPDFAGGSEGKECGC